MRNLQERLEPLVRRGVHRVSVPAGTARHQRTAALFSFLMAPALAGAIIAAGGVRAGAQEELSFRARGDVVSVYATVIKDRRLVVGLPKEAFEIKDEGTARPISVFDNRPRPVRLIVLIDFSGSLEEVERILRQSLEHLLAKLYPEDLVRVGWFGADPRNLRVPVIKISPAFTRDIDELMAVLPARRPEGQTPLWSAVNRAYDIFDKDESTGDARPVILTITDGVPSVTDLPFGEVRTRAYTSNVMFYAVRVSSGYWTENPWTSGSDWTSGQTLVRLAEDTGGGFAVIERGQDLGELFESIVAEIHSQYLLGFEPAKRDGKVHDIDVRVRGHQVRARQRYVAPKD